MDEIRAKIRRQSKTILILAKVGRIMTCIVLGVSIITLVLYQFPPDLPLLSFGSVNVYPLTVLNGGGRPEPGVVKELVLAIIQSGLMLAVLYRVTAVFQQLRQDGAPFAPGISKSIKGMAILCGVCFAASNGFLGVLIAFIIYVIAVIFDYGALLQQEADETL